MLPILNVYMYTFGYLLLSSFIKSCLSLPFILYFIGKTMLSLRSYLKRLNYLNIVNIPFSFSDFPLLSMIQFFDFQIFPSLTLTMIQPFSISDFSSRTLIHSFSS